MLRKAKIAVIHDAFLYRGGGERLVILMAKALDADIISGFFSEGSFDPRKLGFTGKMISLGKPVFMKGLRHIVLKWRFLVGASILREYDIVIFSGDCLGALRHMHPEGKKIYYCHTPPRYLYDFREKYLSELPIVFRPLFSFIFAIFSRGYISKLDEFDMIFTNSQNVYDRLLKYCGYESDILYPPTDLSRFAPRRYQERAILKQNGKVKDKRIDLMTDNGLSLPGSYYLSFARLSPPKRVDLIVDAFIEMPTRSLILTYGANDPMKEEILLKIKDIKNIQAIESPSDDELIRLIALAKATIYIPVDEDFGMSPVESMACGTPVIGSKEGGILETVIDGKTGRLIEILSRERGILAIREAVEYMDEHAINMGNSCTAQARKFSLEKFVEKLESEIRKNITP